MSEEDYSPNDAADKAFTHSESRAMGDLELQPFTPERFVAAQGMGLLWPGVVASGRRDEILYKGQMNDTLITLWLCAQPIRAERNPGEQESWTVRRALRHPDNAFDEAMKWATDRGITKPNSPEFWKATNLFLDIILEIDASYSAPTKNGGETLASAISPN